MNRQVKQTLINSDALSTLTTAEYALNSR